MSIFNHLGVRFQEQYTNPEKPDVLLERFKVKQRESGSSLEIQIAYHSVFLKVPDKENKWWSPELTINIEEHEEGSMIKEVTGPNSGTFTFSMFVITGAFVIFFFALMVAFSQIQLGLPPLTSFLVVIGSVLLTLLVIAILGWGRKKAHSQMDVMREFIKGVL